jgi:N-acyl amino acid synthase of PEP-CTERM/exosortase system
MLLDSRRHNSETDAANAMSLVDVYNGIFEAVPADTQALRDDCFRIRHQVYCVENDFLPAGDHPDGREIDQFDHRSLHGLLRFRRSGASLGTIRAVVPDRHAGSAGLPMYKVCEQAGLPLSLLPPIANTVEISRFAISKQFRQREGDQLYGRVYEPSELARDERRVIPHMTLGLIGLALRLSQSAGVENICAIMEPTLIRLLSRIGIHWHKVGPLVEYHGMRQPCVTRIDELFARVEAERPEVFEVITDDGGHPIGALPAEMMAH